LRFEFFQSRIDAHQESNQVIDSLPVERWLVHSAIVAGLCRESKAVHCLGAIITEGRGNYEDVALPAELAD